MKLVTVSEMVAIEQEANAAGMTYEHMMENAGHGLAESIEDLEIQSEERCILGLVGPGNNGGDTLIGLSLLAAMGWHAEAYLVKRSRDHLVERLEKAGGQAIEMQTDAGFGQLANALGSVQIILDGLLGTGSRPPIRGDVAGVMAAVNGFLDEMDTMPYVIAVDCPSGVDCDSGEAADECIPADLTVTMAAVKQGLMRLPAYELAGDLRVVDIGLPPELPSLRSILTEVVEENLVASILPSRSPSSHKGTFGTALIAAGSVNYTGAAFLAGSAAYRIGAGLVTLAVPQTLHAALAGQLPEATWLLLPQELGVISREAADVLLDGIGSATALLLGPGLGTEKSTQDFVTSVVGHAGGTSRPSAPMGFAAAAVNANSSSRSALPGLVLDADGLKLLARIKDWPSKLASPAVLTPHPGEMSILTGIPKEEIQADRTGIASRFAREWGHVVVLKGAFTIIAAPQGQVCTVPVASAALARAGTGDVLAGIIVGLRAQGVQPYEAAVAGAWIHAQAGLYAARRLGTTVSVVAGDVLDSIADVLSDLPGA